MLNSSPNLVNRRKNATDENISELTTMEQGYGEAGETSRKGLHFNALPPWLQDNNYLHQGHRPPLPSVSGCVKSIFQIHSETGNIWSHLVGSVAFFALAISFLNQPTQMIANQDKIIFAIFFTGVITCLFLSSAYHTLRCHSQKVGKLFHKLDYVGIAILIMASFVPWLYYGFYCKISLRNIYMSVTFFLGMLTIIFSLFDIFAQPFFRPIRAGLFIVFGLSGVVPAFHYLALYGWAHAISRGSMGWLILMGFLYILGALFYANRIPEKWFPGNCDIWFQSHQIFHILVVVAAFVHYYGICGMAHDRRIQGNCPTISLV